MRSLLLALTLGGSCVALTANHAVAAQLTSQSVQKKMQTRIINGQDSEKHKYPFMTALISAQGEEISPFCGASFIGGRYVLTASHCVIGTQAKDLAVWIGGHDISAVEEGKKVNVAQIYLHEEYDDYTLNNDVAIIELVEEVEDIPPIKIMAPEIESTLQEGFNFTVMGWGNTNSNDDEAPDYLDVLQEVQVPLYNRETCLQNYTPEGETQSQITEQMLCAGFVEGGKDSCQGDSGGPLVFQRDEKWYQAGVVSFGNGCAAPNSPGVYARLSQFNQWIEEKMAGVSYEQSPANGYVEQTYDQHLSFTVKNVGKTPYRVTGAEIVDVENLSPVVVVENLCESTTLAFDDSCDIKLQIKADQAGMGKFQLNVSTDHPVNKLAQIFFSMDTLEAESLDVSSLVDVEDQHIKWWGGGDATWQAQTVKTVKGDNAIASGDISDYQSSVLLATLDNDRISALNLNYLVSSEDGYDNLIILHNNNEVLRASGVNQTDFAPVTVTLNEGIDRIALVYRKDSEDLDDVGDDKSYVDGLNLEVINEAPVIKLNSSSLSVEEQSSFTLDASSSEDPDKDPLTFSWKLVGQGGVTIANPQQPKITLVAPKANVATNLTFQLTVTDSMGLSSKQEVKVKISAKPKKSGGSLGWLALVLLPLVMYVRNKKS